MDITKATIGQPLYCNEIINSVRREVINCDTCQSIKQSNKKCGKLPAKLSEEIPCNKTCVVIMERYVMIRKVKK